MSEVFLSYAREDRGRVAEIASALRERGLEVWYDVNLPVGGEFDRAIEQALASARCIVVLWSAHAVESRWVRAEAAEGAERHILVPAHLDDTKPPIQFRAFQGVDLRSWSRRRKGALLQGLVDAVFQVLNGRPPEPSNEPRRSHRSGARRVGMVAGGLAVVTLLAWFVAGRGVTPATDPLPSDIAVMPFEDRSRSGDLGWLASGLADELVDALSGVEPLSVRGPTATGSYATRAAPPSVLADELGVGTILRGYVDVTDSGPRVNVHLVQALTGLELGGAIRVQGRPGQWGALRQGIAEDVATALRQRLGRQIEMLRWKDEAGSAVSWAMTRRAKQLVSEAAAARFSGDALGALRLLHEADSLAAFASAESRRWAEPHLVRGQIAFERSLVARWYALAGSAEVAATPAVGTARDWIALGLDHAKLVLDQDPDSPRGRYLRGMLTYRETRYLLGAAFDSALVGAEADLQHAVVRDPSLSSAWQVLALVQMTRGEFDVAARSATQAFETDAYLIEGPGPLRSRMFAALRLAAFDEARILCDAGQRRFPNETNFRECRLIVLGWAGADSRDVADAQRELTVIESGNGGDPETWGYRRMMVAAVMARAGLHDQAKEMIAETRLTISDDIAAALDFQEAFVRVVLGERGHALELLERYLGSRPSRAEFVRGHPWFRSMHADPRFAQLGSDRIR